MKHCDKITKWSYPVLVLQGIGALLLQMAAMAGIWELIKWVVRLC